MPVDVIRFEDRPAHQLALELTVTWLSNLQGESHGRSVQNGLINPVGHAKSLHITLRENCLTEWEAAIEAFAGGLTGGRGTVPNHQTVCEELLLRAAGELAAVSRHKGVIELVDEILALVGGGLEPIAAIIRRIELGPKTGGLHDCLAEWLDRQVNSPVNQRAAAHANSLKGRRLTDRELWAEHNSVWLYHSWACLVVATVWPTRFMNIIDHVEPAFAHAVVANILPLNIIQISGLMTEAALAYTPSGEATGAAGLFALMVAAEDLIFRTAEGNLEPVLVPIVTALFARPDAMWIARAWLQRSMDWVRTNGVRPRRPGTKLSGNVVALFQYNLAKNCSPLLPDPYQWIQHEQTIWADRRVLVEAFIHGVCEPRGVPADILADSVRRGLISSVGRSEALNTDSCERRIVVPILNQLPHLISWFDSLWLDTYDRREQIAYSGGYDSANPSYPILAWSLQLLNCQTEDQGRLTALAAWFLSAFIETRIIDPQAQIHNSEMERLTVAAGHAHPLPE